MRSNRIRRVYVNHNRSLDSEPCCGGDRSVSPPRQCEDNIHTKLAIHEMRLNNDDTILKNHDLRLTFLESESLNKHPNQCPPQNCLPPICPQPICQPCQPCQPYDPYLQYRTNQDGNKNINSNYMDPQMANWTNQMQWYPNVSDPNAMHMQHQFNTTCPPYPSFPSNPFFPRRPPIIFDGYRLLFKSGYYYLIPDGQGNDYYKFLYLSTSRKWAYQPVNPITLESIDPTFDQPLYYYMNVIGYGWGLVPNDPSYAPDPDPHTISGYQYILVTNYGYCYVPNNSTCNVPYSPYPCPPNPCPPNPCPPNPPIHSHRPCKPHCNKNDSHCTDKNECCPEANDDPCINRDKIYVFDFNYYNPYVVIVNGNTTGAYYPYYYNAYANGVYNPYYKYPFYIEGANPCNVVPFIGGGVGYILPDNNDVYEVVFKAKLRINIASANNLYPGKIDPGTNNYPSISLPLSGTIANIELLYYVVTPTGSIESITSAGTIQITQDNLAKNPNDPSQINDFGGYFETVDLLMTNTINLLPPPNPAGRSMITMRADNSFAFVNATIILSKF
jgi:hypothetical protein